MLTCPNCGYDNELGRLFCHSCGKRLDLAQIKPPSQGGPRLRRSGWTPAKVIRRVVHVVILCLLAWVMYLLLSVPQIALPDVTDEVIRSVDRKRVALENLAMGTKPGSITFTEAELTAYLSGLKPGKPQGRGLQVEPERLAVDLEPGTVTVIFEGKIQITANFAKRLSLRYRGQPSIDGGFKFNPTGGWIGKLALHPKLLQMTGLMDRYFGSLFSRLDHERDLLNRAHSLSVDKDAVTIRYEPARK